MSDIVIGSSKQLQMAIIKEVRGYYPQMGKNSFVAENATIVGEVFAGEKCTFWFNCVVRGDVNRIVIGNEVNIQDGAIIHGTYKSSDTVIGNRVSIGHNAIVHGCTVEDEVLIGMGAIVMDKAVIGKGSVIAAGAVVLGGTIVEPGSVYAGMPAKKVKDAGPEHAEIIRRTADNYPMYAGWFSNNKDEDLR